MRAPSLRRCSMFLTAILVVGCAATASPSPANTPGPSGSAPAPSAIAPSPAPSPSPSPSVVPAPVRIDAGARHTCLVTETGGVRCWGANSEGQLGDGTLSDRSAPVGVVGLDGGVAAVSAGGFHACALTTAGAVSCWGSNEYGQLGDGSLIDNPAPVAVVGMDHGVVSVQAGWSSTCALTDAGAVLCWGQNPFGALGNGAEPDTPTPTQVTGLASGVLAIAIGTLHGCALKEGGVVACWGYGQSADPDVFTTLVPEPVAGLPAGVVSIDAGLDRTCALTATGGLICWGPNFSAPADGPPLPERLAEVDVTGVGGQVVAMAVGEAHACVLTAVGRVACWGVDGAGQIGQGITSSHRIAVPLGVAGLEPALGIAVGGEHTCALTSDGVACWGSNMHGQLGRTMACSSVSVPAGVPLDGGTAPPIPGQPAIVPTGPIEHATGAGDVLLRFDAGPDVGLSDLGGDQFSPGPEFSLFGDGRVVVRSASGGPPGEEATILREPPFLTATLDEERIQELLRFALDEGGLASACESYETTDLDVTTSLVVSIRAGGIARRVSLAGPDHLGPLVERLAGYVEAEGLPTEIYRAERHWAILLEAASAIESGILVGPARAASWPWPDLQPADFAGRDEGGWGFPRRVLTAAEASVLGLSDDGGVVRRAWLTGPDGTTTYVLAVWPVMPDEGG